MDIKWVETKDGNITTVYGSVNGIYAFNICRFGNEMFQNENWVMTSDVVTTMNMIKDKDLTYLKGIAQHELIAYTYKLQNGD